MNPLLLPLAVLAANAAPAQRSPPPCPSDRVVQARDALLGNRLVQAGRMIQRLRAGCGMEPGFRRLEAAWMLSSGRDAEAMTRYEGLLLHDSSDPELLAGAGRAALRLGSLDRAAALLAEAAALGSVDWRAWNALGIIRDRQRQWPAAEEAYARALQLAPDQASVLNNHGYSLLLQGRSSEAVPILERAVMLDPQSAGAINNLELARALNGIYDESRRRGESARAWSRRLNNQGYAALLAGDREAARRLLSMAISASPSRFEAAEQNLARANAE
ncbi:MAG TPA: tetratricopeptide repeat protein [Allosphingosinicella sp.]|nr:tetratricopeptide repeat protein [Allosphingosinicella sp.]